MPVGRLYEERAQRQTLSSSSTTSERSLCRRVDLMLMELFFQGWSNAIVHLSRLHLLLNQIILVLKQQL